MAAEQRFLAELARVARWSMEDDELVLGDENGLELIRLRRPTQAKETTMELIHTCYRDNPRTTGGTILSLSLRLSGAPSARSSSVVIVAGVERPAFSLG